MASASLKLILLPGMDGTGELFARLSKKLANRVPHVVMDYPVNPADTYADLVARLANSIGRDPVVVLGESFGGPIAVGVAALIPGQVKGVILAATFLSTPWPKWIMRAAALFAPRDAPGFILRYALRGSRRDAELDAHIGSVIGKLPREVAAQRLREVSEVEAGYAFNALSCPILVLHGTNDRLVSHRPIARAAAKKAGAVVKLYDAPHMLLQTHADACGDEIEHFFARVGARP